MERRYRLEQIGDAAVVQLYADGFEWLPRDRNALEMRRVLEQIVARAERLHRCGISAEVIDAIRRYAKLFWINSGLHNNLTARKFVLTCAPDDFRAAAEAAATLGATFPVSNGETLQRLLDRLHGLFFDVEVDPLVTCKTSGKDVDILAASANNLYDGVTMADLEHFDERNGLNSRLTKLDGAL